MALVVVRESVGNAAIGRDPVLSALTQQLTHLNQVAIRVSEKTANLTAPVLLHGWREKACSRGFACLVGRLAVRHSQNELTSNFFGARWRGEGNPGFVLRWTAAGNEKQERLLKSQLAEGTLEPTQDFRTENVSVEIP